MPIQDATEPYLPKTSESQPPGHRSPWVRVIVYLVLAIAVGLIVGASIRTSKRPQPIPRTRQLPS